MYSIVSLYSAVGKPSYMTLYVRNFKLNVQPIDIASKCDIRQ